MLDRIAKELHEVVFRRIFDQKTNIFLCGKSLTAKDSLRSKIAAQFRRELGLSHRFAFFYPEELFEELLTGPFHHDLLTLENDLAASVDAVVIVVESLGAAAELGAFANHDVLRQKVIVAQPLQFRTTKSFINYGPVRMLQDRREGKVVFIDEKDIKKAVVDIKDAISAIRKKTKKSEISVNAINADRYLLPAIYVFEEPDSITLREMVMAAAAIDERRARAIVSAGLSLLRRQGCITRTTTGLSFTNSGMESVAGGYRLTALGLATLKRMNVRGRWGHYFDVNVLDKIRVEIMTSQYRRNHAACLR